MRFAYVLTLGLVVITGCARSPQARVTPTPTANRAVTAEAEPSATQTAPPTIRPVSALPSKDLLFQPGDLPAGVRAGTFSSRIPDWLQKYALPDAAAELSFERDEMQSGYGGVSLYFYDDSASLKQTFRQLIASEEERRPGVPQSGIGDQAKLFLPETQGLDVALFFRECRAFAQIRLLGVSDPQIILAYAARLAQQLNAVDCEGAASVPLLTPPLPLATSTPSPTPPIAQVISATVQHLPDPEGANNIRSFFFADANHGWLALGATIWTTTDGGKHWRAQFQVDSPVKSITFVSSQRGWIETQMGYLLTVDGGEHWQRTDSKPDDGKMPPPATKPGPLNEDAYNFCADNTPFAGPFAVLDKQTAWAFCLSRADAHYLEGVRLFQTKDGGKHWQLLSSPPYGPWGATALFFVDQKHGWMGFSQLGVDATDDGGRTWRQILGLDTGSASRIQFLTPRQGFISVYNSGYNDARDTLLRTDDGGATWREIFDAPPPALFPSGPIQFFADGSGIGAGLDGESTILRTRDAGRSWTKIGSLNGACGGSFVATVRSISFPDPQHGWAAIACGRQPMPLYRTGDGGATWNALAVPPNPDDAYAGVSFVNSQTGYAVTEFGHLLRTDDGGATFGPVDSEAVHTASIKFVTKLLGWEVRGVQLFATMDGGHAWKQMPLGDSVQEFALLPDGRAWVVLGTTASAENANPTRRFLTTRDGGATWLEYQLGAIPSSWRSPWLDSIQFADAQHGWLRGDSGLYHTADGGQNWTQLH